MTKDWDNPRPPSDEERARKARDIVEQIKPMLAGMGPDVQGAALNDLYAIWLAGHAPALRERMLQIGVETIRQLVRPNEMIMFGPKGHPDGRDRRDSDRSNS